MNVLEKMVQIKSAMVMNKVHAFLCQGYSAERLPEPYLYNCIVYCIFTVYSSSQVRRYTYTYMYTVLTVFIQ